MTIFSWFSRHSSQIRSCLFSLPNNSSDFYFFIIILCDFVSIHIL